MAKQEKTEQAPQENPLLSALIVGSEAAVALPEQQFQRLTLPVFLKPSDFPIGAVLIARVVRIVDDFTGREDMKNAKSLWLKEPRTSQEFLFPITGVIENALADIGDPVGKVIAIKRQADSVSKKFSHRMFMFDVFLQKDVA